jgi:hypothetical protein
LTRHLVLLMGMQFKSSRTVMPNGNWTFSPHRVLCFVDFGVLEFQPDMQKPRTGLPIEPLANYG